MISFSFEVKERFLLFLRTITVTLTGGTECLVCGKTSGPLPLCVLCRREVYSMDFSERRCTSCGKVLVSEDEKCMECRKGIVYNHTGEVFPLFGYRLWNKELLFTWKMKGVRTLSAFFAERVKTALEKKGWKVIVPVPPRKGKIQKKGWDQIEDLCGFLEKRYGFVVLRILERTTFREQKTLDRSGRLETIGKSYSLVNEKSLVKQLKLLGGKMPESCCLIDDILTTGATAESCAAILKEGGVKRVDVMAIFTAA